MLAQALRARRAWRPWSSAGARRSLAVRVGDVDLVASAPVDRLRHFDVEPWSGLAAVVGMRRAQRVVAALVPASRLGRLDIVGVMRGQSVSPAGQPGAAASSVRCSASAAASASSPPWRPASARSPIVRAPPSRSTVGALMLVPLLLVLAGIGSPRRLPVAPRMATRDAARHRTRSVPTVAAIMAGTIALTIFSIGLASDTRAAGQASTGPQLAAGVGDVSVNNYDPSTGAADRPHDEAVEGILARSTPHLERTPVRTVAPMYSGDPTKPDPDFVVGRPAGVHRSPAPSWTTQPSPDGRPVCTKLGSQGRPPDRRPARRRHRRA